MGSCLTVLRATMDSWLLWRAFTNEEKDSAGKQTSDNDANEEWGRKLLQEVHKFCSSCWWIYIPLFPLILISWFTNLLCCAYGIQWVVFFQETVTTIAMYLAATEWFSTFSDVKYPQISESITQDIFLLAISQRFSILKYMHKTLLDTKAAKIGGWLKKKKELNGLN